MRINPFEFTAGLARCCHRGAFSGLNGRFTRVKQVLPNLAMAFLVGCGGGNEANQLTLPENPTAQIISSDTRAEFTFPGENETVTQNITLGVTASNVATLSSLTVIIDQSSAAYTLCSAPCEETLSNTLTGINPGLFGLSAGEITFRIIAADDEQNTATLDSITLNWQPPIIEDVTVDRQSGTTTLSWTPVNNILRYNLYLSTEENITPQNIDALAEGQKYLALRAPTLTLSTLADDTAYFALITGIDGSGESTYSEIVSIDPLASAVGPAPVANNDSFTVNEDTVLTGGILDNDEINAALPTTLNTTPISAPELGVLVLNADGTFQYTPQDNVFGTDSFQYQLTDSLDRSDSGTVTITISSVNDDPQAVNDAVVTNEDQAVTISALANDSDPDQSDTLAITQASAQNGNVAITTDNTLSYTPSLNYFGADTIVYSITDGTSSASASVIVTVSPVNDSPVAVNDTATTQEDTSAIIAVISNDSDVDGDDLSITSASAVNGSVAISTDNTLRYTPSTNFNGDDSISYVLSDGAATAAATVSVSVTAVNDAPSANNDLAIVNEDETVIVSVLANDSDVDGDDLNITLASATEGSVVINTDGTLSYTPDANFNGNDNISYVITDGAATASATVRVAVIAVNDAPTAANDVAIVNEDETVTVSALANDSDVDGDDLSITSASAANGSVAISTDNALRYTPNANFNGDDSISYVISDGAVTASATVSVSVTAVNDGPTLSSNTGRVAENSANATSVLVMSGADVDVGDTLSYDIVSGNDANIFTIDASRGLISINDNTQLNFETAAQHILDIRVTDSGGVGQPLTADATATINVTDVAELESLNIDTAFAQSGTASSNSLSSFNVDQPQDLLLDENGKTLILTKTDFDTDPDIISLVRFNTDGRLDRTFGQHGVVNQSIGLQGGVISGSLAMTLGDDGAIYVAGAQSFGGLSEVFLLKFSANGSLDSTFSSESDYPLTSFSAETIPSSSLANDIVRTNDGTILVVGSFAAFDNTSGWRLLKFSATGDSYESLDVIFNNGADNPSNILQQSVGQIVLTGSVFDQQASTFDCAAVRISVSSSLTQDFAYGANGAAIIDFGNSSNDYCQSALLNADGSIVLAGDTIQAGNTLPDMAALKLTNTGVLDTNFGDQGFLVVDVDGDRGTDVSLSTTASIIGDSDGNLYFGNTVGADGDNNDVAIYKTNASGQQDTTYATSGQFTLNHNDSDNDLVALVTDQNDQLLLLSSTVNQANRDPLIARYTTSGSNDTNFGNSGVNWVDPHLTNDVLSALVELAVAPHAGKFLAVGTSGSGNEQKLIMTRFLQDGSIDEVFAVNGTFVFAEPNTAVTGHDILELADGRLIAAGAYGAQGLLVIINADGSLDASFNQSGFFTSSPAGTTTFNAIADGLNDTVIVAGSSVNNAEENGLVARLSLRGGFDSSFNAQGFIDINLGLQEQLKDVFVLSTGKVIAVGQGDSSALILQLTSEGLLDTANFASPNGFQLIDLNSQSQANSDTLEAITVLNNGTILSGGHSTENSTQNFVTALTADGVLQSSFGANGIAAFSYGAGQTKVLDITADAQSRVLAAGLAENGNDNDVLIFRLTESGAQDSFFQNSNGGVLLDLGEDEQADAILTSGSNSLILAGAAQLNLFTQPGFFLRRYTLVQP